METWIWIVLLSVVLISLLALTWYLFRENIWNPAGKGAEKKTTRALQKFALLRRFRVLCGVNLEHGGKPVQVENLLVGFFGILMVHTLGARGAYYGTLDGEKWTIERGDRKYTFPNPYKKQQEAAAALRAVFAKEKLYNISIEHIIVLASGSKKTELYITNDGQIMPLNKLGSYLGRTKFEKDTGLDMEAVSAAILAHSKVE